MRTAAIAFNFMRAGAFFTATACAGHKRKAHDNDRGIFNNQFHNTNLRIFFLYYL
jgi:hypothetical protein